MPDWAISPTFVVPYMAALIAIVTVTIIRTGLLSWRLLGATTSA